MCGTALLRYKANYSPYARHLTNQGSRSRAQHFRVSKRAICIAALEISDAVQRIRSALHLVEITLHATKENIVLARKLEIC